MIKYLILPAVLAGIFAYDLWRYDFKYACAFLCLSIVSIGGLGVVIYLLYLLQYWTASWGTTMELIMLKSVKRKELTDIARQKLSDLVQAVVDKKGRYEDVEAFVVELIHQASKQNGT